LTAELAEVHAELVAAALASRSERAPVRAIAEALGLSRPRVYELLNHPNKSRQAGESMEAGPTCG
jgi:DNA invertase Pin-like site-specific DNA recombinase